MTETAPSLPLSRRVRFGAAAFGLLVVGGVAGTVASHALQPAIEMAPLRPVSIASLPKSDGIVTIRGKVAEVYGNKFVIDDGSARTLVDTGRAGDREALAAIGAPVTVQGRFDRGFVHASFLVDQAGKVTALAPMHGPGEGPHGGPGRDGPGRDGPDGDHDGDGPHGHRGPPHGPDDAPPPADSTAQAPAPAPAPAPATATAPAAR